MAASYIKKESLFGETDEDTISQTSGSSIKPDPDYKPTGTTNFIGCYFVVKEDDRTILMDGGLCFHEFILKCDEFFRDYIENGDINRVYYLFACSSYAYNILFELPNENIKEIRIEKVKEILPLFQGRMKETYSYFIAKNKYRDDTTMATFKRNWKTFNEIIIPRIRTLIL